MKSGVLEHKRVTCDMSDCRKHLLRQQYISVIVTVDLHSREMKISLVTSIFNTANDTIIYLLNVAFQIWTVSQGKTLKGRQTELPFNGLRTKRAKSYYTMGQRCSDIF